MKIQSTNYLSLPEREVFKGFHGRFVNTGSMTIAYWKADAASTVPEHRHINEQVVQLISGELKLVVGGEAHLLKAGDVLVIPPDVPHSAEAITDCVIHDIFIPEREAYM
jgi:quercetin dioxygenase-like cupin family protein